MFPESSWLYVHVLLEALWYKSTLHTADVALLETAQGPVAEQVLGWLTAEGSSAPPHHSFSALPLQEGRRTFDENKKTSQVEIRMERPLTNYHYRRQRLSLGEINVTFCLLLLDWSI